MNIQDVVSGRDLEGRTVRTWTPEYVEFTDGSRVGQITRWDYDGPGVRRPNSEHRVWIWVRLPSEAP